ncbi:GNAT family N-acetyltransferase [Methanofollis tationis]|uniref:GNAT family N-acetyltransferase n=1 Tax=Methanofollis tationis TaxID=81417 RepID=A0A7K4HPI7_9EURY|nr:GNAT family N-acetyltransferase [Methanofollis tationis]NVO67176.1 GNAT family N-acetyltransferase [Methanofollis tationis]
MAEEVRTQRLRLVPATEILTNRSALSRALGATVPDEWPPESLADALPLFLSWLQEDPGSAGWNLWYVVAGGTLVGSCGFLGRPSAEGEVEIGYGVLPAFRGRGYATEAAAALIGWAFAHPEVRKVAAQADPQNRASVRVLEKIGFVPDGAGDEGCVRFVIGPSA